MASALKDNPQLSTEEVAIDKLIDEKEALVSALGEFEMAKRQWDGIKGSREVVSDASKAKKDARTKVLEMLPVVQTETVTRVGRYTITLKPGGGKSTVERIKSRSISIKIDGSPAENEE